MTSRRRSLVILTAAITPLALAGCEKPNPGVTAWSGTTSEHVEAVCWQSDPAASLSSTDCAQDVLERASAGEDVTRLPVAPGDVVGISVDPAVAETGWSVSVGGTTLATALTDTYYRFTFPDSGATQENGYTLQVVAQNAGGSGSRGFWFFQLVPS